MTLDDYLDRVTDRETFLDFVQALAEDRADEARKEHQNPSSPFGAGANGWENITIDRYLEAAVRCARDLGKQGHGLPEGPSWKAFAEFLLWGKGYE